LWEVASNACFLNQLFALAPIFACVAANALAQSKRPWVDPPEHALNPGASFRSLHDSPVKSHGNTTPQMLLCLREEHAVAIAHGWAKVTERLMAGVVHSNALHDGKPLD
jgi:hypothetical protein